MKFLLIPLTVAILAIPPVSLARMGETREQCEARYGKPIEPPASDQAIFCKNEIRISASFDVSNKVEAIHYQRDEPGKRQPASKETGTNDFERALAQFRKPAFTPEEINVLLQSNAKETWDVDDKTYAPGRRYHARKAHYYAINALGLIIRTEEYENRINRASSEEKAQEPLRVF